MLPSASTATGLSICVSRFGSTRSSMLPSATSRRSLASNSSALSPGTVAAPVSSIEPALPRHQAGQAEQRVEARRGFARLQADLVHRGQQRVDLERLAGFEVLQ